MSKTIDLSLSGRKRQFVVAVLVVGFFVGPVVAALLSVAGLTVVQAFGVAIVGGLAVALVWVWQVGGGGDGGAWDAIPEWQYDGRFAEAGGLTRSEQEAAIDELREDE